jgi:hypothetical protein
MTKPLALHGKRFPNEWDSYFTLIGWDGADGGTDK